MERKEAIRLYKTVEDKLIKRENMIAKSEQEKNAWLIALKLTKISIRFLSVVTIGYIAFAIVSFLLSGKNLVSDFGLVTTKNILYISALFLFQKHLEIHTTKGPTNKATRDEWLWKNGRKSYYHLTTALVLGALGASLYINKFAIINIRSGFISSVMAYFTYALCVLFISWKPAFFTSGILGGFGSVALPFAGFAMMNMLMSVVFTALQFNIAIVQWTSILAAEIILSVLSLYVFRKRRGVNFVQDGVIRIALPSRLLTALRPYYIILRDDIKAREMLLKLERKGEYGTKQALFEVIAEENKSPFEFPFAIIGAIIAFTSYLAGSLGQSILQDVIYSPYIKPILCSIKLATCP